MNLSNYRTIVSSSTPIITAGYCEECQMHCFIDEPYYNAKNKVWHKDCFRYYIKRKFIQRHQERAR